jgi:hypothetical protein
MPADTPAMHVLSCAGAATGQLLNTLHTPAMSYHGHKQMNRFTQWSVISFLFSGYQVRGAAQCVGCTCVATAAGLCVHCRACLHADCVVLSALLL